jgi:hypothetical protein
MQTIPTLTQLLAASNSGLAASNVMIGMAHLGQRRGRNSRQRCAGSN